MTPNFSNKISTLTDKQSQLIFWLIPLTILLTPIKRLAEAPGTLLAILGIFVAIKYKQKFLDSPAQKTLFYIFLCSFIPICISAIDASNPSRAIKVAFVFLKCYLMGVAIIEYLKIKDLPKLIKILFIFMTVCMLNVLLEYFIGYNMYGRAVVSNRPGGLHSTSVHGGALYGTLCIFFLAPLFQSKLNLFLKIAVVIVFTATLFITQSRIAVVSYFMACGLYFILTPRVSIIQKVKIAFITLTILVLVSSTILFSNASTSKNRLVKKTIEALKGDYHSLNRASSGRIQIWHNCLSIIKDHPLNGVGARNLRYVYPKYNKHDYMDFDSASHPHQIILEYLVGTGSIGLIGLVMTFILVFKSWYKAPNANKVMAFPFAICWLCIYFPINTHSAFFSSKHAILSWWITILFIFILQIDIKSEDTDNKTNQVDVN